MSKITNIINTDSAALTTKVEYKDGIFFEIRFISRSKLRSILTACTRWVYDPVAKTRVQQPDPKLFAKEFCKAALIGWEGLTLKKLAELLPVKQEVLDTDPPDTEILFDQEDAQVLLEQAYDVDDFLQKTCVDLAYFRPNQGDLEKNLPPSPSGT